MASEVWNAAAVPWKLALMLAGMPMRCSTAIDGFDGIAQRPSGREVEADDGGRELPLMADGELRVESAPSAPAC